VYVPAVLTVELSLAVNNVHSVKICVFIYFSVPIAVLAGI
jgi:hypothetical protein